WRTQRPYDWDDVLRGYTSVPPQVRGYDLDPLRRPVRRPCRVASDRWDWYEQLLTEPLPFRTTAVRFAEPGRYRMASTALGSGIEIPDDLPASPFSAQHDLTVRDRKPIEVSWHELLDTARHMDEGDRHVGRDNRWEERLRDVTLQVRAAAHSFVDTEILCIDRLLHLVGLVSVGKTTLVMILTTWAAQHGHRVTIVVGDNSAALRIVEQLSQYDGVRAAPIMGSNRTRHTERLHHLQPAPPQGRPGCAGGGLAGASEADLPAVVPVPEARGRAPTGRSQRLDRHPVEPGPHSRAWPPRQRGDALPGSGMATQRSHRGG